ncbi:MAG: hypothetical protein KGJ09_09180 [Candidatus Omnitrophica bacterium]|nr:hypothetical protein [Candidatus Omnitrophota bacterium]
MKWEYCVMPVVSVDPEILEIDLGNFGKDGWELVHFDNDRAIFKRSVPDYSSTEG